MENCQNNIHIGHLIREQLKADQRSASWLAREIGCTRNHVYKIFNRPSLDADLILKISIAMNFNFFYQLLVLTQPYMLQNIQIYSPMNLLMLAILFSLGTLILKDYKKLFHNLEKNIQRII